MQQSVDLQMMARAIKLAKQGQYTTSPNPNVGCVISQNNRIIGEGWHQRAGQGHAEVNAIANTSESVAGATAYVTLEPCSHFGKTPPCAQALINAGIARVVVAMLDPNPLVSGRGVAMLQQAGIEVEVGVLEADSRALNPGFLTRMEQQRPLVQVKLAASLDGKTALCNGTSQWITSEPARQNVQHHRALSCAILSGADTVIDDNARLNVRYDEFLSEAQIAALPFQRQPARIVIDSRHRLTPELAIFQEKSPIWLVKTEASLNNWPEHVQELIVPAKDNKVDLSQLIPILAQKHINQLWVEAGATLAGALIAQDLVDELILYQAPKLLGDKARSLVNFAELTSMTQAKNLKITDVRTIGTDIKITTTFES